MWNSRHFIFRHYFLKQSYHNWSDQSRLPPVLSKLFGSPLIEILRKISHYPTIWTRKTSSSYRYWARAKKEGEAKLLSASIYLEEEEENMLFVRAWLLFLSVGSFVSLIQGYWWWVICIFSVWNKFYVFRSNLP